MPASKDDSIGSVRRAGAFRKVTVEEIINIHRYKLYEAGLAGI